MPAPLQNEKLNTESPEALLTRLSSKEIFKSGKDTARTGIRLCGSRQNDGSVTALFKIQRTGELVSVNARITAKSARCVCSQCGEKPKTLCPHAFAALLYDLKHIPVRTADLEQSEIRYQGLQNFDFPVLAEKASGKEQTWLRLDVETDFPHIPSKWEKAVFILTMNIGAKLYKGNIVNIRQLHFDKGLASVKGTDFSLQERQILRYLAVNAEADNSRLMLDSEQTAELLHCLTGFPRFYQAGQRIVIHPEPASPVLLIAPASNGMCQIQPAIRFGETVFPLENTRVITGRNGVWVGTRGEYWWVVGTLDVLWMRSFFRNGKRELPAQEAENLVEEIRRAPVEIKHLRQREMPLLYPDIMMDCAVGTDNEFNLILRFCYDETIYAADQARFSVSGTRLALRDSVTESAVIDRLRYFGFSQPTQNPTLFSLPYEAVPMFVTEALVRLNQDFPRIHLSQSLVNLAHPDSVAARFTYKREDNDYFYMECEFTAGTREKPIYWKEMSQYILQGVRTIRFDDQCYLRIPDTLFDFLSAVHTVMLPVKGNDDTFRIARVNIPFWSEQGRHVPGAVPHEFLRMTERLICQQDHDSDIMPKGITHPFKGELRGYQQFGVEWIMQRFKNGFNAVLADEMGLGKTVQALAVLAQFPHPEGKPHLIVCPTSLTENWRREAVRFVPTFRVAVAEGPIRRVMWTDTESYDLMIVSYAVVRRDLQDIQKRAFTTLVLDEAQHIKNPSTANAKSCKAIPSLRRMVLTGTPLENTHEDLWSIFDFLQPNMLGTQAAFSQQYDVVKNPAAMRNLSFLTARLSPFMLRRRKLEVCQELPPKTEQIIYCEMFKEQSDIYAQYLETGRRQCQDLFEGGQKGEGAVTRFDILATLLRLRQICCDPALLPDVADTEKIPSAKTDLLLEVLSQNIDSGHKVLVFSQFTSLLAIIRKQLEAAGIVYEYLDGQTKDRQQRVDRFNVTEDIQVFLLSLKAGGTGLNLTGADTVILYDPWWNPAVENQAADRSHRIGQERPVTIQRLVAKNTIEERILHLQAKKQELFDRLVEDPTRHPELQSLSADDFKFILG